MHSKLNNEAASRGSTSLNMNNTHLNYHRSRRGDDEENRVPVQLLGAAAHHALVLHAQQQLQPWAAATLRKRKALEPITCTDAATANCTHSLKVVDRSCGFHEDVDECNYKLPQLECSAGDEPIFTVQHQNIVAMAPSGNCGGGVGARARARRGEATDLHSISERNRRIRITQKMRELHKLVPDGTKTNKATMLDEIIRFVTNLQSRFKDECCARNLESSSSSWREFMHNHVDIDGATFGQGFHQEPSSSSAAATEELEKMMGIDGRRLQLEMVMDKLRCSMYYAEGGVGAEEGSCTESERRRRYEAIEKVLDPVEEELAKAERQVCAIITAASTSSYDLQKLQEAPPYSPVDALVSYLSSAGISLLPISHLP